MPNLTLTPEAPLDAEDSNLVSFAADTTEVRTFALSDVPADFLNMETLQWKSVARTHTTPVGQPIDDTYTLEIRIVTSGGLILASATSDLSSWSFVNSWNSNAMFATYGFTGFAFVHASYEKAVWDDARLEIRQVYSQNMGGDNGYIQVDHVELSGVYTSSGSVPITGDIAQVLPALGQSVAATYEVQPDPSTLTLTQQGSDVLLEWSAPIMPSASHIAIFRREGTSTTDFDPTVATEVARVPVAQTSYTDTSVGAGDYTYQVYPVDA